MQRILLAFEQLDHKEERLKVEWADRDSRREADAKHEQHLLIGNQRPPSAGGTGNRSGGRGHKGAGDGTARASSRSRSRRGLPTTEEHADDRTAADPAGPSSWDAEDEDDEPRDGDAAARAVLELELEERAHERRHRREHMSTSAWGDIDAEVMAQLQEMRDERDEATETNEREERHRSGDQRNETGERDAGDGGHGVGNKEGVKLSGRGALERGKADRLQHSLEEAHAEGARDKDGDGTGTAGIRVVDASAGSGAKSAYDLRLRLYDGSGPLSATQAAALAGLEVCLRITTITDPSQPTRTFAHPQVFVRVAGTSEDGFKEGIVSFRRAASGGHQGRDWQAAKYQHPHSGVHPNVHPVHPTTASCGDHFSPVDLDCHHHPSAHRQHHHHRGATRHGFPDLVNLAGVGLLFELLHAGTLAVIAATRIVYHHEEVGTAPSSTYSSSSAASSSGSSVPLAEGRGRLTLLDLDGGGILRPVPILRIHRARNPERRSFGDPIPSGEVCPVEVRICFSQTL